MVESLNLIGRLGNWATFESIGKILSTKLIGAQSERKSYPNGFHALLISNQQASLTLIGIEGAETLQIEGTFLVDQAASEVLIDEMANAFRHVGIEFELNLLRQIQDCVKTISYPPRSFGSYIEQEPETEFSIQLHLEGNLPSQGGISLS